VYAWDLYSSPLSVAFASAYTIYPAFIRLMSTGDIILGEQYNNAITRHIWIGATNTNTITRIGVFGDTNSTNADFVTLAVDAGLPNSGQTIGAWGPLDDITLMVVDTNPSAAADTWGFSIDGSVSYLAGQDVAPPYPYEGAPSMAHYPWFVAVSQTMARRFTGGISDTRYNQSRPKLMSDPQAPGTVDQVFGAQFINYTDVQSSVWATGTLPGLPFGIRPGLSAVMAYSGYHRFGTGTAPTIDEVPLLHSSVSAFSTWFQAGAGGSTHRPEFALDGYGYMNFWLAMMYYGYNRQALTGSWPSQFKNFFNFWDGTNSCGILDATMPPIARDLRRPVITVTGGFPVRVNSTSVRIVFTTDKPCLGFLAGGDASGVGKPWPYPSFTQLETTFSTSHDITLTGLPDNGTFGSSHVAACAVSQGGAKQYTTDFTVA
jgi:hypothetical protein